MKKFVNWLKRNGHWGFIGASTVAAIDNRWTEALMWQILFWAIEFEKQEKIDTDGNKDN